MGQLNTPMSQMNIHNLNGSPLTLMFDCEKGVKMVGLFYLD